MTGMKDLEGTIARLDEAYERVRDATREANSATKELRSVIREGREVLRELTVGIDKATETAVEERVGAIIRTSLDEMAAAMNKALATAADDLQVKLERQTNMTLYGNTQGKGRTIFEELTEQADRAGVTIRRINARLDQAEHRLEGS